MTYWKRILICLVLALTASGPARAEEGSSATYSNSSSYIESVIPVETMQITLIQGAQIRGMLIVSIGLYVPDGHLRQETEHVMPRLRDAFISQLSRHGATRVDPRRVIDVEMIADLLQTATDRVLGTEGAEVLLVNVLVRAGLNRQGAITSRQR